MREAGAQGTTAPPATAPAVRRVATGDSTRRSLTRRPVATSIARPSRPHPIKAPAAATRIDLHQHLLPPDFLDALRQRETVPRLVDGWTLLTEGESPYSVNPVAHDVERRRLQELSEGKAEVLVSIPGNLRVEELPFDDARDLIEVWHRSALQLGAPFRVWAATPLRDRRFDLDGLSAALAHEQVVGLQIPATSLATSADLERLEPVLRVVEAADKPVLVHPRHIVAAPVGGVPAAETQPRSEQLKTAWSVWNDGGRQQHPSLRIAFIALAGLAPLSQAASTSRAGRAPKSDPNVFYETSAYDQRAIDAMARIVGLAPLVHGSDRPFRQPRDPELGRLFNHALFSVNPRTLLTGLPGSPTL